MNDIKPFSPVSRGLIVTASAVVVLAGMRAANEVLSPIVFAAFLAILTMPLIHRLRDRGLSFFGSVILMIFIIFLIAFVLAIFLIANFNQLQTKLPVYAKQFSSLTESAKAALQARGIDTSSLGGANVLEPARLAETGVAVIVAIISSLSSAVLIFLLLLFMLAAAPALSAKTRAGTAIPETLRAEGAQFAQDVRGYMWVSTLDNFFVAALFTPLLFALGVDFALLWGLLALILSYIPTIGLVLAAAPAVAIGLLTGGVPVALAVVAGAVIINFIGDNIFMPRVASRMLSLTPLTIILSFLVWAYLFGLLGGLFSVPLTLAVKAVLGSYPETRWIADAMVEEDV